MAIFFGIVCAGTIQFCCNLKPNGIVLNDIGNIYLMCTVHVHIHDCNVMTLFCGLATCTSTYMYMYTFALHSLAQRLHAGLIHTIVYIRSLCPTNIKSLFLKTVLAISLVTRYTICLCMHSLSQWPSTFFPSSYIPTLLQTPPQQQATPKGNTPVATPVAAFHPCTMPTPPPS